MIKETGDQVLYAEKQEQVGRLSGEELSRIVSSRSAAMEEVKAHGTSRLAAIAFDSTGNTYLHRVVENFYEVAEYLARNPAHIHAMAKTVNNHNHSVLHTLTFKHWRAAEEIIKMSDDNIKLLAETRDSYGISALDMVGSYKRAASHVTNRYISNSSLGDAVRSTQFFNNAIKHFDVVAIIDNNRGAFAELISPNIKDKDGVPIEKHLRGVHGSLHAAFRN